MKKQMRNRTYIAADFDHDENAVKHLRWMKNQGTIVTGKRLRHVFVSDLMPRRI